MHFYDIPGTDWSETQARSRSRSHGGGFSRRAGRRGSCQGRSRLGKDRRRRRRIGRGITGCGCDFDLSRTLRREAPAIGILSLNVGDAKSERQNTEGQ
jgi:hypothetical protein